MKILKILCISLLLLLTTVVSYPQDKRTTETKVADLLARLPSNDPQLTNNLMADMLSLGDIGIRQICNQIIPTGNGDDTRARYAVESLSRYISWKKQGADKDMWEDICINYAKEQTDFSVKDFFMKQLQQIGGIKSAEAVKSYLTSKEICNPALAVISAAGGNAAEAILAESLKDKNLQCPAAVMNTLAIMNSQVAVNEYISWATLNDVNIKASAYNALARSGNKAAYSVLLNEAKAVAYRWEPTGATESLLTYAKVVGQKGDLKTSDKICKLVMSKCDDNLTIQNKTAALDIYVALHGIKAMDEILKASAHSNNKFRSAAIRMSLGISGSEITKTWISYFPKAIPDSRPEIINMLGQRSDPAALPLVTASLSDSDFRVRNEASVAIVNLSESKSIPALVDYMMKFADDNDQEAAKSALMTVCGDDNVSLLLPVLKSGNSAARESTIELLAWNKNNKSFNEVLPFASSEDELLKAAAIKALADLAGPSDQIKLIELISGMDKPEYISEVQFAIANAALRLADSGKRSSVIIKVIEGSNQKAKLIPVLSRIGGNDAIKTVLSEFENGNPEIRDVCFKTLTNWKDYIGFCWAVHNMCIR